MSEELKDIENTDAREARETVYSQAADNRGVWYAWTNDPVMDRKLRKVGAVVDREYLSDDKLSVTARSFTLKGNQVSLRNPPKPLTEKQRIAKTRILLKNTGVAE